MINQLPSDRAAECARSHRASFAHGWNSAELEALLAAANTLADGAFIGSRVAGFVLSRLAADEAEILTIAVDPAQRHRGLGRKLLDVHLPGLVRRGVERLFLEVAEDNGPALGLYRAFGFREVGRRPGYYRSTNGGPVSALTLRLNLA